MESNNIGVLLLNLGTPDQPDAKHVRAYLSEFLSDRRIVNLPAWQWKPILHGIILRTRPAKSAAKYASIWTENGSPFMVNNHALVEGLRQQLQTDAPHQYTVQLAMRYGRYAVAEVLDQLMTNKVQKIVVIPLYPQYSSTTTASALDSIYQWGLKRHYIPEFRFVNDYHALPDYINALAQQVQQYWLENGRGEKLVISFHGIPQKLVDEGDPYHQQCLQTAELLSQALTLTSDEYEVTFQSRFGKGKWLEPSTQHTIEELAKAGTKSLDVICPGFSTDCLETLEEINMECKSAFLNYGGLKFHYIPCLNANPLWVLALSKLVMHHTSNWTY